MDLEGGEEIYQQIEDYLVIASELKGIEETIDRLETHVLQQWVGGNYYLPDWWMQQPVN